jgi:hypothetical protein
MINRMVFVRLKEEYRTDAKRGEIATHSEDALSGVPQVRRVEVGTALDDKTRQDWDLLLAIQLEAAEDLEPFRLDPIHRDYVDNYLKPKIAQIKGWNFSQE